MKRKLLFSGILVCALILSGCEIVINDPNTSSEQNQEESNNWNGNNSSGDDGFNTSNKGNSSYGNSGNGSNSQSQADLSLSEVLKKSRQSMAALPGYEYRTNGNQTFTINLNGKKSTSDYQADLTLTLKNKPFTYMDLGSVKGEKDLTVNTFNKNNMTYFIMDDGQYGKTGAPESQLGLFHSPRPGIILKNISTWTNGAPESKLRGVLNEQGNYYVIDLDIGAVHAAKKYYLDEMANYGSHKWRDLMSQGMGDLKWDQATIKGVQQVYIDRQTFQVKKMVHDLSMTIPVQGAETIEVDQKLETNWLGTYSKDITVPADLKNQAQDVQ